jgi:hypothetical protein
MLLAAIDIDLKNGHLLKRQTREEFVPFCGICKVELYSYGSWFSTQDEAVRMLHLHLEQHKQDIEANA